MNPNFKARHDHSFVERAPGLALSAYRYVRACGFNHLDSEEAAAEAIAQMWTKWNVFGLMSPSGQKAMARRIALRRAIDEARRASRRPQLGPERTLTNIPDSRTPETTLEETMVDANLARAFKCLSPSEKSAVWFVDLLGYTETEAARVMSCTRSTVNALRRRAVGKMHGVVGGPTAE